MRWTLLIAGLILSLLLHDARADGRAAAHAVLERVIGASAAAQVSMSLLPAVVGADGYPIETFSISGTPGNIVLTGTTTSALTRAAGWYLKYVARADVALPGEVPTLPNLLPAPPVEIRRSASVPHRYVFNDTNEGYTDPYLPWPDRENQLDILALQGINEIYVTVGTDYVFWQLLQRYGYGADELRTWIPDPAHQPWWVLQNIYGGDAPISESLLIKRAQLGRQITDRARELGMTPVLPGYWGTVPVDFGQRNRDADVVPQGLWLGYPRPGWLNPTTSMFARVAADYYAISATVLGSSTMYKMDPLHEGGERGHVDLKAAATSIEAALQNARPGATWVILAWQANPLAELLQGITDKSRTLILASEADATRRWDSGARWPGFPYALGSIYSFGGRAMLGANAATIAERWAADKGGANGAQLRGIALFPESWSGNPAIVELMTELPWYGAAFDLPSWFDAYAIGRYGTNDSHALAAWSLLRQTAFATPPDDTGEAHDSLFNAQPDLKATNTVCCGFKKMRYSGPDLETAWSELLAAGPSVVPRAAYRFDLVDVTRQVIANRARVLLPLIRRAYDTRNRAQFGDLSLRWLQLADLLDRVEGTHPAFMLGPRIANARDSGADAAEKLQLERTVVKLLTNWGLRIAYDSGARDYANRDWNCLTSHFYRARWARFFDAMDQQLGGGAAPVIDWFQVGEDFINADHSTCATTPTGDIVTIAGQARALLDMGPEKSTIPSGWSSFATNDGILGSDPARFVVDSGGSELWMNSNDFGAFYQRLALRDGGTATVRVAAMAQDAGRPWARAGLMAGTNVVSAWPDGFVDIAITPGHGCVFSWARNPGAGLDHYQNAPEFTPPVWVRLSRLGETYVGACSVDGVNWKIVGSARPDGTVAQADIGIFASAVTGGGSDRLTATFDQWKFDPGTPGSDRQLAVEYFHAGYQHYFVTAIADEVDKLDTGYFDGWARTGEGFPVHVRPGSIVRPVCRFYTVAFPPTSSHFYGARGLGCEGALLNRDWLFEGEVFQSAIPDANGGCPVGEAPVYRLYNNGQGGAPNHRFTTSTATRSAMLAHGFIAEGTGIGVGLCSPQ